MIGMVGATLCSVQKQFSNLLNKASEVNQLFPENYLATLAKKNITTNKPTGLLVRDIKKRTKP